MKNAIQVFNENVPRIRSGTQHQVQMAAQEVSVAILELQVTYDELLEKYNELKGKEAL